VLSGFAAESSSRWPLGRFERVVDVTLEPLLQAAAPHLSTPLVSVASLRHLQALSAGLPRAPVHRCGIECRLGEGLLRTDFCVCVRREGAGRLMELLVQPEGSGGAWVRLARLCTSWRDSSSSLHNHVPEIWLGFDLEGPLVQRPDPVVSLSRLRWKEAVGTHGFSAEVATVCHAACALHSEADAFPINREIIDRCLSHLSPEAVVVHVGALGARRVQAVRLVISVRWQEIVTYLTQIGWPGQLDRVGQLAERYGPLADSLSICLDLGTAIAPCLGVELFPSVAYDNRQEIRVLLDLLVSDGLCTPTKGGQVLGWPGSSPLEGGGLAGRTLSHLKINLRDGCAEAKAYFALAEVRRIRTHPLLPLYRLEVGGDCA